MNLLFLFSLCTIKHDLKTEDTSSTAGAEQTTADHKHRCSRATKTRRTVSHVADQTHSVRFWSAQNPTNSHSTIQKTSNRQQQLHSTKLHTDIVMLNKIIRLQCLIIRIKSHDADRITEHKCWGCSLSAYSRVVFSPTRASEPERSPSRGTLKHTAGHVDWTCASRLLCGRSLCYRNTEYRNDFLLLFPQNSPPTVLKESLRTRQFLLKHCRQHRLFVCDNEPPQTLDERHCFQKNLWFCSPRYEHWKWKDERIVFKYLKWVYPGGVLSLWTCGGAEKRLCSAGPGATRVFGPGLVSGACQQVHISVFRTCLLLTSERNWTLWFLLCLCVSVRISLQWLEQIQITCCSGVLTSESSSQPIRVWRRGDAL